MSPWASLCRPRWFTARRLGVALGDSPLGVLVSPSAIRCLASCCCPWQFAARRLGVALSVSPWCLISVSRKCINLHSVYQLAFSVPISVPLHCPAKTILGGGTYQSRTLVKNTFIQCLCFFVGMFINLNFSVWRFYCARASGFESLLKEETSGQCGQTNDAGGYVVWTKLLTWIRQHIRLLGEDTYRRFRLGLSSLIQGWVPDISLSNNNANDSFGLTMGLEDLLEGGGERQSTMWTGLMLEWER